MSDDGIKEELCCNEDLFLGARFEYDNKYEEGASQENEERGRR